MAQTNQVYLLTQPEELSSNTMQEPNDAAMQKHLTLSWFV